VIIPLGILTLVAFDTEIQTDLLPGRKLIQKSNKQGIIDTLPSKKYRNRKKEKKRKERKIDNTIYNSSRRDSN
jgi:hypothetical protein